MSYIKIENYSLKLRIYPNKKQTDIINDILWELKAYHNNAMYAIKNLDKRLVKEVKVKKKDKDGKYIKDENGKCIFDTIHYLDKGKLNASFKSELLKERNQEIVKYIPSCSVIGNGSIVDDIAKAFKRTGKNGGNIPIESVEPHYYSKGKPRESFALNARKREMFRFSDNNKVMWIDCGKGIGEIKCRRQTKKLKFSENGMSMEEFFSYDENFYKTIDKHGKETNNLSKLSCSIKRDNCGDYFLIVSLPYVYKEIAEKEKAVCGIDVGIKTKATIYNATEDKFESIENKTFLYKNGTFEQSDLDQELIKLNEILSRKWGYANKEFREVNKKSGYIITPSKQYMTIDKKRKKLNRKIKRQREANNHLWSHYIINNYETIGLETLSVKEFLEKKDVGENENRSHKENMKLHNQKEFRRLASDTGLGQFLEQIVYKANWYGNQIVQVDKYFASSQICSSCGYKNSEVKNVHIREWNCPVCGKHHDRDENAAKNIYFESERISLKEAV